jgi:ketosteroid isomerase-like protein
MRPRLVLLLLVILLLAAPIQTVPAQVASTQAESNSQQQISAVLKEWSRDWKARDAEAISALYAPDAVFCPAIGPRVDPRDAAGDFKGPHAIRDYFRQLFERLADPKIGDFVVPSPAQESGDLAFDDEFVQYLVKGKCRPSDAGDGPCVLKSYDLIVLQRSSGSKWQIVRHSFTQIGLGSTIYTPQ